MAKKKVTFILTLIDRGTNEVVQTYTKKSEQAADRLWSQAIKNVNPLKYKMKFERIEE